MGLSFVSFARRLSVVLLVACSILPPGHGHGQLTYPPSNRQGGTVLDPNRNSFHPFVGGGHCQDDPATLWFTTNTKVPKAVGETLPKAYRTVGLDLAGEQDVFQGNPWRAPGSAAVKGAGCGVAAGGRTPFINGAIWNETRGRLTYEVDIKQGDDAYRALPASPRPTLWARGATVDVAWSMAVNHGGGYTYRLCRRDGERSSADDGINEACFQRTILKFAGNTQWLLYSNGTKVPLPLTTVSEGTHPAGSTWARNPIPECRACAAGATMPPTSKAGRPAATTYDVCGGAMLKPVPYTGAMVAPLYPTTPAEKAWDDQCDCTVGCKSCTPETTAFPPATRDTPYGTFGFGGEWDWSLLDKVVVPRHLKPGNYVLSWRVSERGSQFFLCALCPIVIFLRRVALIKCMPCPPLLRFWSIFVLFLSWYAN